MKICFSALCKICPFAISQSHSGEEGREPREGQVAALSFSLLIYISAALGTVRTHCDITQGTIWTASLQSSSLGRLLHHESNHSWSAHTQPPAHKLLPVVLSECHGQPFLNYTASNTSKFPDFPPEMCVLYSPAFSWTTRAHVKSVILLTKNNTHTLCYLKGSFSNTSIQAHWLR